jgi:hypothetical protein
MQGSRPERKPHVPASRDGQPKATPAATYSSAAFLLRICSLLLGSLFVIVFGLTLFVVLIKGSNPPVPEPAEQSTETTEKGTPPKIDDNSEKELRSVDSKSPANNRRDRDNAASPSASPPALPPPPLKTQPATHPLQPPSQPAAVLNTEDKDTAFEIRLQTSEEELLGQLSNVPELRLFSDLVVQNFREMEKNDERTVKGVTRDQIDYAYNAQMHKYMRQAGLQEGLPILSGAKAQLDPDTAMIVQTLSKNLRDMGFVSIPGTPVRVSTKSSGSVASGTPKEKVDAFQEWCDVNTVEKFRGALATLVQVLQVEDVPMRLLLVRELAKAPGPESSAALATAASVDLSPQVRQAAVAALEKRPAGQYVPVLLQGLRYPWAPVADHAALALRKLKPEGVVPKLVALLDRPDPSLPVLDRQTNKPTVRELIRLNHMRNCLLCHAPSANDKDGLVRGLVPTPGQPLPRLYYAGQKGNFVRADIASLRQDFSVNLPVAAAAPWPNEQRFDFVTRVRPAKPEEMEKVAAKPGNYPQRDAVLYALRGLTGKDSGDTSAQWRKLLGLAIDEKR